MAAPLSLSTFLLCYILEIFYLERYKSCIVAKQYRVTSAGFKVSLAVGVRKHCYATSACSSKKADL